MGIFQKRGLIFETQTQYKLTAKDPESAKEEAIRRVKEGENVWISEEQAEAQNLNVGWHILSKYRAKLLIGEHIVIRDSFTKIGRQAFMLRKDIKSVIIPDSVTYIGNAAFLCCENLAYIEIPDSVTHIQQSVFEETPWYDNHPDGVVYAGKVAYNYKGDMPKNTHIVLRSGTVSIADEAFANCDGYENLVSITIPDSVTHIGKGQFENCVEDFRKNITIHCREGSYAHKYAAENGIKFELTEECK